MARPLRLQLAGEFFHVLTRGNARQPIFLGILHDVVVRWGLRCQSYCLMGNHYHLLLQPQEPSLSGGDRSRGPVSDVRDILKFFDAQSRAAAQEAYRRFVASHSADDESLRSAIEQGGVLGGPTLERLFRSVDGRHQSDRLIREAYDTHAIPSVRSRAISARAFDGDSRMTQWET